MLALVLMRHDTDKPVVSGGDYRDVMSMCLVI